MILKRSQDLSAIDQNIHPFRGLKTAIYIPCQLAGRPILIEYDKKIDVTFCVSPAGSLNAKTPLPS
jgi:hypothetical protein